VTVDAVTNFDCTRVDIADGIPSGAYHSLNDSSRERVSGASGTRQLHAY